MSDPKYCPEDLAYEVLEKEFLKDGPTDLYGKQIIKAAQPQEGQDNETD